MTRALFLCSRNRLRSPTAEAVFSAWSGIETDSAGLAPDADTLVTEDHVQWAEIIFVMEAAHKARLVKRFGPLLKTKRIVCLNIPDKFTYMQAELVAMLEKKAGPFLRG